MKFLYQRMIPAVLLLMASVSCSSEEKAETSEDPFSGLPVIDYAITDITDEGSDNPDEFYFRSYYFNDMALGPNGSLFLNFFRAPGILEFGPEGNFRGLIGSRGEGPGEFQFTPKFDLTEDRSLYTLDVQSRRVTQFRPDSSGWILGEEYILVKDDLSRIDGILVFGNDRVAIEKIPALQLYMNTDTADSLYTKSLDIYQNGELLQQGLISAEADDFSAFVMDNGGAIFADTPYGSSRIIDKGPSGKIYFLDTRNFNIEILNPDGSRTDSIIYPDFTIAVPDSSRRNRAEEIGASSGTEEGDRKMKEMIYSDMPETGHPLNNMFVDEYTGYILLSRDKIYPGPHWLLIDDKGERIGTLDLDPDLRVFDFASGRIAGSLMKDDIIPTVRLISLDLPVN